MQVCLLSLSGEVLARFDVNRFDQAVDLAEHAARLLGLSIDVADEVWAEDVWEYRGAHGVPSRALRVDLIWGGKRLLFHQSFWEMGLPVRATVAAVARDSIFYRVWFPAGLRGSEFWDCVLGPEEPLSTLACRWASQGTRRRFCSELRLEAEHGVALSLDLSGADLGFPLNVAFVNLFVRPRLSDLRRDWPLRPVTPCGGRGPGPEARGFCVPAPRSGGSAARSAWDHATWLLAQDVARRLQGIPCPTASSAEALQPPRAAPALHAELPDA